MNINLLAYHASIGILLSCSAAAQEITYLGQTRYVEASASAYSFEGGNDSDMQFDEALDFGPFDSSVSASADVPGGGYGDAIAAQVSTLDSRSISATGSTFGCGGGGICCGGGNGTGESFLEVTFDIAELQCLTLTGELWTAFYDLPCNKYVELTLTGPGGDLLNVYADFFAGDVTLNEMVLVDPGQHTFTVLAHADAGSFESDGGSADFDLNLTFTSPSCPSDFNDDDVIDVLDLLGLLGAWGTSDPTFDIAPDGGDGSVDVLDLLAFLADWGQLCPGCPLPIN